MLPRTRLRSSGGSREGAGGGCVAGAAKAVETNSATDAALGADCGRERRRGGDVQANDGIGGWGSIGSGLW